MIAPPSAAPRLLAVLLAVFMTFAAGASPAWAQDAPAAAGDGARARLDRARAALTQSEATLQRPDLRDAVLQGLRASVETELDAVRAVVDEAAPRVDTLKARLAQLGARPAAGAQPESPEMSRDRAERERALKEAEDTLAIARALVVQGGQIAATIGDRRRGQFARLLFERSFSPLNPLLWWQVMQAAPRDGRALAVTLSDWGGAVAAANAPQWLAALGGFLAAFAIVLVARRLVARYARRDDPGARPSRREKAIRAGLIAALGVAAPIGAAWVAAFALDGSNVLPARAMPVAAMALIGFAVVAAVAAVAQALFAPDAPNWRLPRLDDANAATLRTTVVNASIVHMAGKFVETVNQSISAALPLTIATRALFALVFVGVMWRALSASKPSEPRDDEGFGPYVAPAVTLAGPARIALAAALAVIAAATLSGFVALGAFLIDQVMWIGLVVSALALIIVLVDEFLALLLSLDSRTARVLIENVGLRRRSIEQLAVVANGVIKLFLYFTALLLIIAPWGVQSDDIFSSVRSALFGVQIGDVTVSFSAIVGALIVLGIGVFLTRSTQRWLDDKLLPRTDLDPGIKNSIRTALGYAGVVAAAALAVSSLGLSLDRVAIIAGALSVGIGFGLQSIVNNFVSGLILLWERPIRVGDLVDVGGDQGIVRRINVRATEIETFDRATVIMPNSNLVSGVVKNRVHNDRTGRVIIPVTVPRAIDLDSATKIMTEAAGAHDCVMRKPEPRVLFKKFSDAALEFELVCFVGDVDQIAEVSSDLTFAIFRAVEPLRPAAGATKVNLDGVERIGAALDGIAGAIEGRKPEAQSGA